MHCRMAEAGQIGLDVYEVLLALEQSESNRLTMSELADVVLLSPSGVTRLVDRLERSGYVSRECNPADRRSMFAVITPKGLAAREKAWPTFRDGIREEFANHLSDEDAEVLTDLLLKFVSANVGVRVYT